MLVTLRQLQYIIAVNETGSFSKAAEVCHAEQSTISQQVRTLEERLGVMIFDRSTLPVRTTAKGTQVVQDAKEVIKKVDDLERPFKSPKTN